MKLEEQLKLQAWLDNELDPSEARKIAAWVTSDPEARALCQELKETKVWLGANEPVMSVPDTRDFYWSQIARRIESEGRQEAVQPARGWFVRWVAPLAGACAMVALAISVLNLNTRQTQRAELVPYGPPVPPAAAAAAVIPGTQREIQSPVMSTMTFHSESEGMTVVWISNDI